MLSVATTSILKRYVAELVKAMPENWESIVVYTEFLRSPNGADVESVEVGEYIAGGELVRDFRSSLSAHMAVREFFLACENDSDHWSGLRVEASKDGKYKSRFFYESTPLLEGNHPEVDKRINGIE